MVLWHPYLSCSASWPFCTSWTQRWWDRVLCPWVVSLQCAASEFPDPTYSHRFCFSWCTLPTRSTGPPRSPLQKHTETVMCSENTTEQNLEASQRPRVKLYYRVKELYWDAVTSVCVVLGEVLVFRSRNKQVIWEVISNFAQVKNGLEKLYIW